MDLITGILKPLGDVFGLIFFAFFGGIIRTIYRPRSRNISAYFLSIIISVPVGVLAGNIGIEYGYGQNLSKAIAVVAGIVAHDIIEGLFWMVDKVRLERESVWQFIWSRLTGSNKKDDSNDKPTAC